MVSGGVIGFYMSSEPTVWERGEVLSDPSNVVLKQV